jgi:DNA primase
MNRTAVEEIKARISIEELISSYIKIEKSGKSYKARCPFHNEKTPSFFISPDRGGYYCFGCGAKGDIFSFVEQFEGLDFKGALKVLAEKAGVKLEKRNDSIESDSDKLFKMTEEATKYFEEQYGKSKEAQAYIKSRGITVETRQAFRIGWAPEGWQNLFDYLRKKGWQESLIEKAGFIKKSDPSTGSTDSTSSPKSSSKQVNTTPRYYDRFRGRIIFPITDSSGRVVAFTGRILHDDGKSAKYLNSPETPIFTKSQILFGLDKAKSEIRRLGYSILVEGQMDLVLSHQVGVKNTIAASGTALTDQAQGESGVVSNLGLVRRLSPNMIIALDSDKAGRTATMRAVAATALSMGMSVKIADAVALGFAGKDPADLILSNPENWRTVLKNAKHVIEFELGNIIRDVGDSRLLAKAVRDRVFPFLARVDSEMDKAYFVKIIAEKAMLNEQAVWEDLRKFEKTNKQDGVAQKSQQSANLYSGQKQSELKNTNSNTSKTNQVGRRFDLVERRLFGLLHLMENLGLEEVKGYREKVKKIAGDSYEERMERLDPIINDLSFEAESLYGDNSDKWKTHIKELLINFEEDLINEELILTMGKLRVAEKEGDTATVAEMAKKCQVLSIRKGKVGM